jgi:hypothetical protein
MLHAVLVSQNTLQAEAKGATAEAAAGATAAREAQRQLHEVRPMKKEVAHRDIEVWHGATENGP